MMKIGIIGPRDSVTNISYKLKKIDSSIECHHYIREEVSRIMEVVSQCEAEVDSIILTGIGVKNALTRPLKKPSTYISRDSFGLLLAYHRASSRHSIDSFSIDVVSNESVQEIAEELSISINKMPLLTFSNTLMEEEYANWHKELFNRGETNYIFTCFGNVYSRLKEEGYPVFRVFPTYSQVKVAYKDLLHKNQVSKLKSSQIAVQIIRINQRSHKNYYDELNLQNKLEKEIISYVRETQGALYGSGRGEYIISATRGTLKDSISSFTKLMSNVKFDIYSGIGYGATAHEADINARNALLISQNKGGVFIIDGNGIVTDSMSEKEFENTSRVLKIKEVSDSTNISPIYISRIMNLFEKKKELLFTSKELAGYLEISERSARRIINKLTDYGYGTIETEENFLKGRPRNILKIQF